MVDPRRREDAPADDLLVVVELGPPQGIRGEIQGKLFGVDPEELRGIPNLWLRRGGETLSPVRVESLRPRKGHWVLAIGLHDREDAERHRGAEILARREDLPEPEAGEWYVADLVGLRVRTEAGEELGKLREVLTLPANDVAVVHGERGEVLVPLLEHVVLGRDDEWLTVRLPAGLLEEGS